MLKIIIYIIFTSTLLFSQSAGNSGLSFLKLGFGARNIAMGDAGNAASNDVTALFYNPAKLSGNSSGEIMLMHNEWIEGVRSEILGAKAEIFGLPFALGLNVTSISDIEIRTGPGLPEATFNANYFFGSLSTGFEVINNFDFGISFKYLYEGLLADESTGYGFDLGINYRTDIQGLNVAAVIKNLGSMSELRNESTKLPAEIRAGPAYSFSLENSKFSFVTALEFQKYLDADDSHFLFGAEVLYDNLIALRGGYQTGFISKEFTAGMGLIWGMLNFDYAFTPFMLGFGAGHSISLNFKF
jgi:hypothetical protein